MEIKPITLTLVIPAYNEERYLIACLDSVAVQTVMPSKVIVVDNNSTDNTQKVAEQYPFVQVMKEPRQGIVFARNRGFNAVKSDLIGRIDADTILEKDWVETAVNYFTKNGDVAAITGTTTFYDFHLKKHAHILHSFVYFYLQKKISGTNILWASNMVITRNSWLEVRHLCNETNDVHEDIDLSICLKNQHKKIEFIKNLRVGVSFRRGELSFSTTRNYLKRWPQVYFKRQLYIKGLLIYILVLLVLLAGLPLFLWHSLFRRSDA
jgi:glycosyltransferase involved in cell wall biosynthesis